MLVEGITDESIFNSFKEKLAIDDIVVESYDGKSSLNTEYLQGLKSRTGFDTVESLGIIRDADTSAEDAFRSVQGWLEKSGMPVPQSLKDRRATANVADTRKPLTVSVFILPNNKNPGELETLLCQTLDSEVAKCIDAFMKCAKAATGVPPAKPDKARVAAYVAVQKRVPHSLTVSGQQGVWDFNQKALSSLAEFLRQL